jgi:alkaline phosphatase D
MSLSRRSFLVSASATSLVTASGLAAPSYVRAAQRPVFTHGVQSGDVNTSSGMIWTRVDRPSRINMEISTVESFKNSIKLPPMNALPDTDFAAKRLIENLPSDQDIFYRFSAADLSDINTVSEPIIGRFRTAPASRRNIRFAWSGDTAGQGWGIDEVGMKTYATMARHEPDFFLHSGDTIYADGAMEDEVELKDGSKWVNKVLIDEKRKVAETLDEYRGQWKYNMMDEHVRALNAICPTFFQWDDHEVVNNWSDSKDLTGDDRYTEKSIHLLAARAGRAFHEMTPISYTPAEPGRVYRKIAYGPLVDVFFLDMRSYIAADMPIGLVVRDGDTKFEAIANADDGAAKGREFEVADLLRYIKNAGITNTVWLTADVHYTAAHYYDPSKAQFQDFEPFWEFVSGPLHAGTFGPNALDMTFGPEVKFVAAPTEEQGANLPPSMGLQFFGLVDIDGTTEQLTVRLMNRDDQELWNITLDPVRNA